MPENEFNKELNEIGVLIQKGGNQGIHAVIKKLSSTQNPMLEQAIESMILQASKDPKSPYAMLVDKDGTINYAATTKISQITNPADFINNLDQLEEKGIPFSEADVEELINDTIESEIEELEEIANDTSEEMTEEEVEAKQREVEAKASMIESTLSGVAKVGKAAVLVRVVSSVRSKVASTIGGLFSKLFKKKNDAKVKDDKKSNLAGGTGKPGDKKNDEKKQDLGKADKDKTNPNPEKGNDPNKSNQNGGPTEKKQDEDKSPEAKNQESGEPQPKSRDDMTLDEKIADEAKDNPWIIPALRKGKKMRDGVEINEDSPEVKNEKGNAEAADDMPGNIDDGPGSNDIDDER